MYLRIVTKILSLTAFSIATTAQVCAQWTATVLHPASTVYSEGWGVHGMTQGGLVVIGSTTQAALWAGSASSYTNVHPAGAVESNIYGVGSGNQQVGTATYGSRPQATLWNGPTGSVVNLDNFLFGSAGTFGHSVNDGQQVGYVQMNAGGTLAALWLGTAGSFVDLNPVGVDGSYANGVANGFQVGSTYANNGSDAAMWNGSAASWVNLNPGTDYDSEALGVGDGQQVGRVWHDVDGGPHAALWSGTASSFVNLHPGGLHHSEAFGVDEGMQCGHVFIDPEFDHASVWSGSAASWEDLHLYLDQDDYAFSTARGIWRNGNTVFVVGDAYNTTTNNTEAILWTKQVDPASISGVVNSAGGKLPLNIAISFRNVGTQTEIGTANPAVNQSTSIYLTSALSTPNVDMSIKPAGFLRRTITVNTGSGHVTNANFNLIPGDIVNDNVIDLSDYTKLVTYFNANSSDVNWNTPDAEGTRPSDADLNGDGVVDLTDYTLIVVNFNAIGDN
ncbi:MAG: dockerin type I repeat-containing protein [Armatimonadetes bacterium]|nr:dockerin type I repeat-containing protein [Armatimonadota bacterium]